jgi:hypothetical protein
MIIKLYETSETSLVKQRVPAPAHVGGEFGCINLLIFSSIELRQRFGLRLADTDAASLAELVEALEQFDGQPTGGRIDEARVALLVEAKPNLLPCFIGYQETPTGKLLPLMTDGPAGRWSIFFAETGAMTLVEHKSGEWHFQTEADLLPGVRARSPFDDTKAFLLSGLRSARSRLVRSDEDR